MKSELKIFSGHGARKKILSRNEPIFMFFPHMHKPIFHDALKQPEARRANIGE